MCLRRPCFGPSPTDQRTESQTKRTNTRRPLSGEPLRAGPGPARPHVHAQDDCNGQDGEMQPKRGKEEVSGRDAGVAAGQT